jgi:signal transduction histidine kinase
MSRLAESDLRLTSVSGFARYRVCAIGSSYEGDRLVVSEFACLRHLPRPYNVPLKVLEDTPNAFEWGNVPVRSNDLHKLWRSATLCLVGGLGLASITVICIRLRLNLATVGFLYMIVVVLLSRMGDFVSSIFIAVAAACCLAYVAPPAASFRVDDPLDIVAIVAFLTTSVIIARLVSRLRKMAADAVLSVNRKLIDSEEREYTRIARDLNEDINQRVALVAFGLEQLGELEPAPSESVAEASLHTRELWQRVSEIGADIHAISNRLRSSNLEYLGIETSAKAFCEQFAELHQAEVEFKSHNVPNNVALEISFPLFRVLQEALLNSVKHSGKRHYEVELFGTSGTIHLTVSDSGSGFDPAAAILGRGLGLTSMRERLKLVKGELSIDSEALRGTKIHASVPLS